MTKTFRKIKDEQLSPIPHRISKKKLKNSPSSKKHRSSSQGFPVGLPLVKK